MCDEITISVINSVTYLQEIETLHALVRQSLNQEQINFLLPKSSDYFLSAINDSNRFLIAVFGDNRILGFGVLMLSDSFSDAREKKLITAPYINASFVSGKIAILQSLCVVPTHKGKGISKSIVKKAIEISKENSVFRLYAQAASSNTHSLNMFYNEKFIEVSAWKSDHERILLQHLIFKNK